MDRRVDALSTPANHNTGDDTVETMPTTMSLQTSPSLPHGSPFKVKTEDLESLAQSGGFVILRDHLAEYYNYEYVCFFRCCNQTQELTAIPASANTTMIPRMLLNIF